jgi:hypothetical protein
MEGSIDMPVKVLTCGGSPGSLLTDDQKQRQFFAARNLAVVPHSSYSPDMAIGDFLLILRMKSLL